jgi:hypothetical protein
LRAGVVGVFLLRAPGAQATELSLFPPDQPPAHYFPLPLEGPIGLDVATLRGLPPELLAPSDETRPDVAPKLFTRGTAWLTTGVLVAMSAWAALGVQKDDYTPWKVTHEKFFGEDTYAGGADKVSHFILSAFLARELGWAYEQQGHPKDQSLALSLGVTIVAGFIQEIGDAFTPYGYAWEDIVADTLGGVTGAALSYYELNDLIGLRFGFIPNQVPPDPCCVESLGENYSNEIYSGDLKIAGLAKRMRFNPGPARFLLVSATYSTKAYGFDPPREDRQRNVGIDIGLNLPEVLKALCVPETTWWGAVLYKALNLFRIPYTSFGVRYDMNHKKWHGPDTGQGFD